MVEACGYIVWRMWWLEKENGTFGASWFYTYIYTRGWNVCIYIYIYIYSRLKCERRCLFSCLHFERISDFLFSRVFCDGSVMMGNFSWRQRRHSFMFYCRQVLVLVTPRWLWERCLCLLVAICTRIRRYWMRSSCIRKKDYGCGFFVL